MKWNLLFLFLALTANAQLSVALSAPKIIGQKAVIKLVMKNDLTETVEEARAACFLLDDQGKMVGQSTKWVIGKDHLDPKGEATFNFVITTPRVQVSSNLTAKVIFTSVILEGGKSVDPRKEVEIIAAASGQRLDSEERKRAADF